MKSLRCVHNVVAGHLTLEWRDRNISVREVRMESGGWMTILEAVARFVLKSIVILCFFFVFHVWLIESVVGVQFEASDLISNMSVMTFNNCCWK